MLACYREIHQAKARLSLKQHGWLQVLPFRQFHVLLTLFPKCFSSFPHGTCSLSVSPRYLALDGVYHPLWAAIPNYSTLGACITKHGTSMASTGFSPSTMPCSKGLVHRAARKTRLEITTRTPEAPAFKFELFPLRSPLLGESLLVSFPPLIDMLKFSG